MGKEITSGEVEKKEKLSHLFVEVQWLGKNKYTSL